MGGWIKVHRSILNWEWYDDSNTVRVFLHLLLNAAHKPTRFRGETLKPGQLVTSRAKIAKATRLSDRAVRTALTRLKTTNEVTSQTTNRNTIITIINWHRYQLIDQPNDQQTTSKRPTIKQEEEEVKKKDIYPPLSPQGGEPLKTAKEKIYDPAHIELAEDFWEIVSEKYPYYKRPNQNRLVDPIRKLVEVDGYTIGQVEDLADWALKDEFWEKQIRSTANLRKHFIKMLDQSGLYAKWEREKCR